MKQPFLVRHSGKIALVLLVIFIATVTILSWAAAATYALSVVAGGAKLVGMNPLTMTAMTNGCFSVATVTGACALMMILMFSRREPEPMKSELEEVQPKEAEVNSFGEPEGEVVQDSQELRGEKEMQFNNESAIAAAGLTVLGVGGYFFGDKVLSFFWKPMDPRLKALKKIKDIIAYNRFARDIITEIFGKHKLDRENIQIAFSKYASDLEKTNEDIRLLSTARHPDDKMEALYNSDDKLEAVGSESHGKESNSATLYKNRHLIMDLECDLRLLDLPIHALEWDENTTISEIDRGIAEADNYCQEFKERSEKIMALRYEDLDNAKAYLSKCQETMRRGGYNV